MRVSKLRKMISRRRFAKATVEHEYEDQFRSEKTPRKKKRLHKKSRGDYYGRYWYPYNDD